MEAVVLGSKKYAVNVKMGGGGMPENKRIKD